MQIQTTVNVWKEDNIYIAHAMPIDVASAGDSPAQARSALNEAVELFVETAKAAGTLDELLLEAGYEKHAEHDPIVWHAPHILEHTQDLVTV